MATRVRSDRFFPKAMRSFRRLRGDDIGDDTGDGAEFVHESELAFGASERRLRSRSAKKIQSVGRSKAAKDRTARRRDRRERRRQQQQQQQRGAAVEYDEVSSDTAGSSDEDTDDDYPGDELHPSASSPRSHTGAEAFWESAIERDEDGKPLTGSVITSFWSANHLAFSGKRWRRRANRVLGGWAAGLKVDASSLDLLLYLNLGALWQNLRHPRSRSRRLQPAGVCSP